MATDYETLELLIDGEWRQGSTGASEPVLNPATEEVLGQLPHASAADLDQALDAADRGFQTWRHVHANERANVLKKAAALMRANAERIARIMTMEQGKPLAESRFEVEATAERTEWAAEQAKRIFGRMLPPAPDGAAMSVVHEPVGPVLGLAPWNFPAMMPGNKIAHALAAGCSIIVKPAEETPGTAIAIARLFEEAGLPKGVLNVVFGKPADVSSHLIASPVIRKVSFTGSVPVGKHLYRLCADGMKRITMELGGHSPVVVFDDVDVEKVAKVAAAGKYRNAGQVCIAPTRFYVQDGIYDRFVDRFAEATQAIKVGNGLEAGIQMGPMANKRRIEAMEEMVADAVGHGAQLRAGGKRMGNQGYFWEPTVLADVPEDARIMNLEPFGPVAPVSRFGSMEEVIARSNRLPYGLAAYAFTSSSARAGEIAAALEAGMVGVNSFQISGAQTPFGGVKDSGIGREGGLEGLPEYLSTKLIARAGV